jgi:hypothetical protein
MMSGTRALAGLCLAAGLVFVAGPAGAQEKARQRPQQLPPTCAEDSVHLTPEDEQGLRTLDAITSRSTEGLTFEERADGTIGLDLAGRFMHVLTAAPNQTGHLDVACHTGGNANPKGATASSVKPWRPVRGQTPHRLNVNPLKAPIVAVSEKAPVLEEK